MFLHLPAGHLASGLHPFSMMPAGAERRSTPGEQGGNEKDRNDAYRKHVRILGRSLSISAT